MKKFLIGAVLALAAVSASAQTILICAPVAAKHNGSTVDHSRMNLLPVALTVEYVMTQKEKFVKVPGSARSAASYGIDGGGQTQTYLNMDNGDRVIVLLGNSNFPVAGVMYMSTNNLNIMMNCQYR
jgi:hypothetical protein